MSTIVEATADPAPDDADAAPDADARRREAFDAAFDFFLVDFDDARAAGLDAACLGADSDSDSDSALAAGEAGRDGGAAA